MPRFMGLKTNFVGGEVSPLMTMRSELKVYGNAALRARNVVVLPQGGAKTRPGTRYIETITEKSAGVYSDVRMAEFQFSTEQTYLFVFSHLRLDILKDDAVVATVITPWEADDLRPKYDASGNMIHSGISWVSDLDTMLVFHEDYQPRKIVRQGSHSSWAISLFEPVNVPRFAFNDGTYGTRLTATISAPLGTPTNLSNANDGNDATSAQIDCSLVMNDPLPENRRFLQLDLGSVREIGAVALKNITQNGLGYYSISLLSSSDGVTWAQLGEPRRITQTALSFTNVKKINARYIAISGQQTGSYPIYAVGGLDVYDNTVGVNEVQTLTLPNPAAAQNWTDNDSFTLLLEDQETTNISYTTDATILAARIRDALDALPNITNGDINVTYSTTVTSTATFTINFGGESGGRPWGSIFLNIVSAQNAPTFEVFVSVTGKRPGEPVWSDDRGWPRCGLFFQGRLWVGGSKSLPNYIWATRSTTIDDFNADLIDDDFGIAAQCDTVDVPVVLALVAGRHLQVFTSSAEFYVPISEVDKITPGNIILRRTSSRGIQPGIGPIDIDGGTVFVQRRGRTIREFLFADVELAYRANDISLLSAHIINLPVAMALKRSSSTEDADFLYVVNTDGTIAVLCTLRTEEVNAFTLWQTNGQFHDAAAVLDAIYFAVIREVDGVETMMIEKADTSLITDCAISAGDLVSPASGATVAHLGSETVQPVLDGMPIEPIDLDDGEATFSRDAENSWEVGLRWPECDPDHPGLIWLLKTMPIEVGLPSGAMFGKRRRITEVTASLYETTALIINGSRLSFRQFGSELLDQPIAPFTGVRRERGLLGFDFEGTVVMGSDEPSRATVLGLSYGVQI